MQRCQIQESQLFNEPFGIPQKNVKIFNEYFWSFLGGFFRMTLEFKQLYLRSICDMPST